MSRTPSLDRLLFGPVGPVGGKAAYEHLERIQAGQVPGLVLVGGGGYRLRSAVAKAQSGCDCPVCRGSFRSCYEREDSAAVDEARYQGWVSVWEATQAA